MELLLPDQFWVHFDHLLCKCLGLGDLVDSQLLAEAVSCGLGLGVAVGNGDHIPLVSFN